MSKRKKKSPTLSPETIALREKIAEAYNRLAGNVSAVARELGTNRATLYRHIRKMGGMKKGKKTKVASGTIHGVVHSTAKLPAPGKIQRYICTSAQNNTYVHDAVWQNLVALSKYYDAQILIGTYSYNKNKYGPLAVKRGTKDSYQTHLWYDNRIEPFISDDRIELGNGLVWCGEMNIMPTDADPLNGLETYSGRKSGIFPHTKIAMRSIATAQGDGTKLNFTTGTTTQRNYIQKKAGLKAEHHHTYGGLLVEVDSKGHWWVRQLDADAKGRIQDLDVVVENGKVTTGNPIEAITWGDIHATTIDPTVYALSVKAEGNMLDTLKPDKQFIHDLMEGASVNHHEATRPYSRFKTHLRGLDSLERELKLSTEVLNDYTRKNYGKVVVVNSNHDRWMDRFLDSYDPRRDDPKNAEVYFAGNAARYEVLRANGYSGPGKGTKELNITEYMIRKFGGYTAEAKFLDPDESYTICNKRLECGQHGHLGPDGARGGAANLNKVGRRSNIGHTHSAGIWNGLYVAGTSTTLGMGYNHGPSSWTHSHILTYPNGKRSIITMFAGKWRA